MREPYPALGGSTTRIVVSDSTGQPTEIRWFIDGRQVESSPVHCSLELAKYIGCEVVDRQIAEDPTWATEERRHNHERFAPVSAILQSNPP